jgi:N-acetyl-anhydromuramyl-L-alanine amidase AmpD
MQKLWETKATLAWCAGGNYNTMALNNEISGVYFDNTWNPGDQTGHPPQSEIDRAIKNICWMMKTYKIPVSQIYGHCQLSPEKCGSPNVTWDDEPGPEFLQMIRDNVKNCN